MAKLFISAGEPSGDLLAGELLDALGKVMPGLEAFGICGPRMREAGAEALFGIEELAVMGFVEVLKHLPYLKRLEFSLLEAIDRRRPDVAVLVDYPGFHLRLADALRLRGIFVIQYVAPQLWAWGEKRTETLKTVTDEVLGIMPFEAEFFRQRGVVYRYVGTPQVDRAAQAVRDRARFSLSEATTIGFFPGSRYGEISRLLPRMLAIREELRRLDPTLRFAISAAPHLDLAFFARMLGQSPWPKPTKVAEGLQVFDLGDTQVVAGQSIHLMKSCDAALVTSGTATLECALVQTPMAVVYVMQPLSYQLAKRFVKLSHISLVNLVAGQGLIKEFIQNFAAREAADELLQLARPGAYRTLQSEALRALGQRLQGNLAEHAAAVVATRLRERASVQEARITDFARA
jgi:lipid-A-disaccharide synthase